MFNYNYYDGSYYNNSIWDAYWRNYRIDMESAAQIATQRVPGRVVKIELDYENGILVYEVDIMTPSGKYELHVDAATGQILKIERDYDWS